MVIHVSMNILLAGNQVHVGRVCCHLVPRTDSLGSRSGLQSCTHLCPVIHVYMYIMLAGNQEHAGRVCCHLVLRTDSLGSRAELQSCTLLCPVAVNKRLILYCTVPFQRFKNHFYLSFHRILYLVVISLE